MKGIDWLLEFLSKGTDEILKLIDEVFGKVKNEVEKLAINLKEYFSNEGKTEEFFRTIELDLSGGKLLLSASDIKKLRRLLADNFGIVLEIVDSNPSLRNRVKYWDGNRIAASFNPIEGKMFIRKSVSAYTIQHEMYHMKLW